MIVITHDCHASAGRWPAGLDRGQAGTVSEHANQQRIARTRAFFGPRAANWEERFPDDGPRFQQAVAELAPIFGGLVLDAGCGTGRALPFLREAVGPSGVVVAFDLTPEMLYEARRRHPAASPAFVLGDVVRLPFLSGTFDAVIASGLVSHLPDAQAGLQELARVCGRGARLGEPLDRRIPGGDGRLGRGIGGGAALLRAARQSVAAYRRHPVRRQDLRVARGAATCRCGRGRQGRAA